MLSKAMPTVFVRDMDAAIRFYAETLGMKVTARYGNHFASLDCDGLAIGLHPASAQNPAGSVSIGFRSSLPIHDTVAKLKAAGAVVPGEVVDDTQLLLANFQDPDGTPLYVTELKKTDPGKRA